jgi:hypothetical protein
MEAPKTPVQWYATVVGGVMLALGVLALVTGSTGFGTVGSGSGQDFLIWRVNGWDAVLYIVTGAAGLFAASRIDSARTFALVAGAVYAVMAVWGFIDGGSVFGLFAVDTTDNITNAIVAALGLGLALPSESVQREAGYGGRHEGGATHA